MTIKSGNIFYVFFMLLWTLLWIVSWFLAIWIGKYRAELLITGLFSIFLLFLFYDNKEGES